MFIKCDNHSSVLFCIFVVPPDILDPPISSADTIIREGDNVTLRCAGNGSPKPNITWRREENAPIPMGNGSEGMLFYYVKILSAS